eukprot:m.22776 g.22776  ORF g.22776 m.22776 type:complete len:469 (+) comp4028_c0_seq1:51-1457(+)
MIRPSGAHNTHTHIYIHTHSKRKIVESLLSGRQLINECLLVIDLGLEICLHHRLEVALERFVKVMHFAEGDSVNTLQSCAQHVLLLVRNLSFHLVHFLKPFLRRFGRMDGIAKLRQHPHVLFQPINPRQLILCRLHLDEVGTGFHLGSRARQCHRQLDGVAVVGVSLGAYFRQSVVPASKHLVLFANRSCHALRVLHRVVNALGHGLFHLLDKRSKGINGLHGIARARNVRVDHKEEIASNQRVLFRVLFLLLPVRRLCIVCVKKVLQGEVVLSQHRMAHDTAQPTLQLFTSFHVCRLTKFRVVCLVRQRRHTDARVFDCKTIVQPLKVLGAPLHNVAVVCNVKHLLGRKRRFLSVSEVHLHFIRIGVTSARPRPSHTLPLCDLDRHLFRIPHLDIVNANHVVLGTGLDKRRCTESIRSLQGTRSTKIVSPTVVSRLCCTPGRSPSCGRFLVASIVGIVFPPVVVAIV